VNDLFLAARTHAVNVDRAALHEIEPLGHVSLAKKITLFRQDFDVNQDSDFRQVGFRQAAKQLAPAQGHGQRGAPKFFIGG